MQKFREEADRLQSIGQLVERRAQLLAKRGIRRQHITEVLDPTAGLYQREFCLVECVGQAIGQGIHAAVHLLSQMTVLVEGSSETGQRIGQIGGRQHPVRGIQDVGQAVADRLGLQPAHNRVDPGDQGFDLFFKPGEVQVGQAFLQPLEFRWSGGNLEIDLFDLMVHAPAGARLPTRG